MCPDYSGDWAHTVIAVESGSVQVSRSNPQKWGNHEVSRTPKMVQARPKVPSPTFPTLGRRNQIRTHRKFKVESLSPPVLECGCQRLKDFPGRVDGLGSPDSGQRPGSA